VNQSTKVFYLIVFAQFCGTSLWFAGNAILPQLPAFHEWPTSSIGWITSGTQLGFIVGTLLFALAGFADRFSPSKIFFACSIVAAFSNVLMLVDKSSFELILVSRFLVGFFLAGIYPIGMKIASDWQESGLGQWLGALVGALVIGTSLPYGFKAAAIIPDASLMLIAISLLCFIGGVLVYLLVPDGPYRKLSGSFSFDAMGKAFTKPSFRGPALGYFGHMWELYALWAFIPFVIQQYLLTHHITGNVSLLTFMVIGAGALGCYFGGQLSLRMGSERIATIALVISGMCCLLSPLLFQLPPWLFFFIIFVWGVMAAADSPQFSALVARTAPDANRGSAITLVVCIGFAITIFSIQLLSFLHGKIQTQYLLFCLSPGPIFGVLSMLNKKSKTA
jgi:MFS family permease